MKYERVYADRIRDKMIAEFFPSFDTRRKKFKHNKQNIYSFGSSVFVCVLFLFFIVLDWLKKLVIFSPFRT